MEYLPPTEPRGLRNASKKEIVLQIRMMSHWADREIWMYREDPYQDREIEDVARKKKSDAQDLYPNAPWRLIVRETTITEEIFR